MEQISLQYPSWTLILCVLLGALYAAFLYFKSRKLKDKSKWVKPLLGFLRFLTVAIIAFLLLGPLIKSLKEESKQPSIALLLDNSQSISEANKNEGTLASQISSVYNQLNVDYEVDVYAIDNKINLIDHPDSLSQTGQLTNLSQAIEYIGEIYEGENLGAVILASDGIFNEGKNPLYSKFKSISPIYTVALGDTTKRKDVAIKQVLYNSVAYYNDEMSTQIDIQGYNTNGERVQLVVEKANGDQYIPIAKKDVILRGENAFVTVDIPLEMNQIGINHYRYRISPVSGEANRTNNRKDVYVEVLDARQNIGIIAAAPHPDIAAFKALLEQNKNYEVKTFFQPPNASELSNIDLAILHQLPAAGRDISGILSQLDSRKTPRLYILGPQTNIAGFNSSQEHVNITGVNGSTNQAQALVSIDFVNFTLSEGVKNITSSYPPLLAPFGEYNAGGSVQTLLTQKIGNIETDFPLLSFADKDGIKTAYLFGTDIWRWKLYEYLQEQNYDHLTELMDKIIMYTSTKEDKRKFRVSTAENIYTENDNVTFSAELYNNSYELVTEPDVFMTITNQDKSEYSYTFTKSELTYLLNAGKLPKGRYDFKATTTFNGEQFEAGGRFAIREIQFELYDLQARHNVLYALSDKYNGRMFYPSQLDELISTVSGNDNMKPLLYQNIISKPLMDIRWIFALLAALLGVEWIIRRYFGSL